MAGLGRGRAGAVRGEGWQWQASLLVYAALMHLLLLFFSIFLSKQVQEDCLALAGLARTLRAARFSNGALRLDGLKLCFRLDKDGNPLSSSQYVQREANQVGGGAEGGRGKGGRER